MAPPMAAPSVPDTPTGGAAPPTVRWSPRVRSEALPETPIPALKSSVIDPFLIEPVVVQADTLQNNVRPSYAIYMFDPAKQTLLIVAAPPAGSDRGEQRSLPAGPRHPAAAGA